LGESSPSNLCAVQSVRRQETRGCIGRGGDSYFKVETRQGLKAGESRPWCEISDFCGLEMACFGDCWCKTVEQMGRPTFEKWGATAPCPSRFRRYWGSEVQRPAGEVAGPLMNSRKQLTEIDNIRQSDVCTLACIATVKAEMSLATDSPTSINNNK